MKPRQIFLQLILSLLLTLNCIATRDNSPLVEASASAKIDVLKTEQNNKFREVTNAIVNYGDPIVLRVLKYIIAGVTILTLIILAYLTKIQHTKYQVFKEQQRK